ncbi:MAG: transcription termination/antitermination protein NusA [Candidatus Vogelbacteria bacterium CG10_big_fil_rev_8_21_14_0_10_51_16]|uniref:Transcription termination/antitermination protein NusA n=1 Tax=Candidatus Vogelbacteria bacterium CG10_big_fil_rev_8_21_14_0_10_51_16 TaxID=1975045 RepID=A0A2H0RF02_9BACT|nr:MAG: transcription termination/antitermination protein NusA [Candidatus Vogelbacteria bacterium CG10_big_fil_rev_8_21_14_0_10_51_16]
MLDLKVLQSALTQLEEEKGIAKEKVLEAIELALAAAYKKEYAERGQIIRAKFDINTGTTNFWQVKKVVDESVLRDPEDEDVTPSATDGPRPRQSATIPRQSAASEASEEERKEVFNEEKHIMLEDARKIRADAQVLDEITFPLDEQDDFGRIAAQAAKQVIIQKIREAERASVLSQYAKEEGGIVSGTVQSIERGTIFVDLGKAVGIIPREEQLPTERFRQGERLRAYLYQVEEGHRGVNLRLSRAHPQFIAKLFAIEAPEISSGTVVIQSIAREPGSRAKIAVYSKDSSVDPIGACVGQRGIRVSTVITELGGEKIDIIEWAEDQELFITNSLSPARINRIELDEATHTAKVTVDSDQFSLAIGKGGQNVRLAAKLTGWKIDIVAPAVDEEGVMVESAAPEIVEETPEKTEKNESGKSEESALSESAPAENEKTEGGI